MYLKKLEISGFKSFANKTTLVFSSEEIAQESGITAIVGPNGAGKSNIADAIRWAIGEQSAKNLRGKKSEDIIFAGSGKKARLGSASVSLFFDNNDKRIPLEFSEVVLTRKLFRSGESEYMINGSRVRLMDVTELLAKAGIGKDSYCVITQGMSDALLNASALERRGVFEDVAGVKPYQLQKEKSIRKMAITKDNMARVEGLLLEIEPHLKNLKRQAEKAMQGKSVAESLRMKQLQLFGLVWHHLKEECFKVTIEQASFEKKFLTLEAELSSINEAMVDASAEEKDQKKIDELEKSLRETRVVLHGAERDIAIVEGRLLVEKERRISKEVIKSTPVDLVFVRARLAEFHREQETLIKRLGNVEQLSELQDLKELACMIQTRMAELSEDAGKGAVVTKQLITLPKEELKASDARLTGLSFQQSTLVVEQEKLKQMIAETEAQLSAHTLANRMRREKFFELEHKLRLLHHEIDIVKERLNESKIRLAKAEVREDDLREQLHKELSLTPDALASRMEDTLDKESLERDIMRLKVQLEHIGGIDPLIVDEYLETEKRFVFLTSELTDLMNASVSLQTVVKEMEKNIEKAFEISYAEINGAFQHYFSLIFGGGKAELSKVFLKKWKSAEGYVSEEDDEQNESKESESHMGIEIFACPPGKKITNLSMLSGGERSLTSLALLFAFIAHNPPPFAVLDEVEASLDEANSRRLSCVLQEFSKKTQFVAITHNRETMRQASLLYGVTMGDDGVSKLLSVRLDQVKDAGELLR
jgi:chromosome segregation protein